MDFLEILKESHKKGLIPDKIYTIFVQLHESYKNAVESDHLIMKEYEPTFLFLLKRVEEQIAHPYVFESYHQKITSPIDYQQFSLEFTRPLVDESASHLLGLSNIKKISEQIERKENVMLFANHQTEVDPQLIHILLEKEEAGLASNMIYIAGDRVLTDPMAIPFSLGCNLICIYSKRHIDNPPEKRAEKQLHNQKTMRTLVELFDEGGHCIYVAPAGGRDRPNGDGVVEVADFDPQSIEMFRLMAQKSKKNVHFYPLALETFEILPPPRQVQGELGEKRKTSRSRVMVSFGDEIFMDNITGLQEHDRHKARQIRADAIHEMVKKLYQIFKTM